VYQTTKKHIVHQEKQRILDSNSEVHSLKSVEIEICKQQGKR